MKEKEEEFVLLTEYLPRDTIIEIQILASREKMTVNEWMNRALRLRIKELEKELAKAKKELKIPEKKSKKK